MNEPRRDDGEQEAGIRQRNGMKRAEKKTREKKEIVREWERGKEGVSYVKYLTGKYHA